jgi:hypothetical protein
MTPGSEFDWVRARANCTAGQIFASLKMGAGRDVEARNATLPQGANYKYAMQSSGEDMFGVVLSVVAPGSQRMVFFKLADEAIVVTRSDTSQEWTVVPTINNEGQCRLKVNDTEYECWQFRKMALEDLLFSSPFRR